MPDKPGEPDSLYIPISHDELLQLRKEFRERNTAKFERQLDDWRESKKIYAEQTHAIRVLALNNSVEHGKIFIRFMFLLNGGAMVALLALIGAIFGKSDGSTLSVVITFAHQVKIAFYFYIAGLIFTAATAVTGYANWSFVFRTYFNEGQTTASISSNNLFPGQNQEEAMKEYAKFDRLSDATIWVAVAFGLLSILAFLFGSLKVASAFAVLGAV